MISPSSCEVTMQCESCSKAVDNAIAFMTHPRGYHQPAAKGEENLFIFILKGELLVNSQEYAGVLLHSGEFIMQAVDSKFEMLAITEVECVYYHFSKPVFLCDGRFKHVMQNVLPPLIFTSLKITPELNSFLDSAKIYLNSNKICRELLLLKRKELAFILTRFYSDYELSMIVHPMSKYTNSFQYFVFQNHAKVKTVEEFALLGGYTPTTFRRIFTTVFHKPVYEWMIEQRKEGIEYDLRHTDASISEICYKYGFESLPHFSNFCKKNFGASPRNLRASKI